MFYHKTWSTLKEEEHFKEPEEGVDLMRKGGFAYHAHPDVVYPYISRLFDNRGICELTEVHLQKPVLSTFAIARNSSFTEIIKIG